MRQEISAESDSCFGNNPKSSKALVCRFVDFVIRRNIGPAASEIILQVILARHDSSESYVAKLCTTNPSGVRWEAFLALAAWIPRRISSLKNRHVQQCGSSSTAKRLSKRESSMSGQRTATMCPYISTVNIGNVAAPIYLKNRPNKRLIFQKRIL